MCGIAINTKAAYPKTVNFKSEEVPLAIVWSKHTAESHYEVRSAGQTVRLYTNGVFHSQFNPGRTVDGSLWDLLSLPALLLPPQSELNVLVLGVGGGAVIRQLSVLLEQPRIAGVDLDPVHVQIARRWFGISETMATLVEADAIEWLEDYQGEAFDLVIDDLFGEQDGEPVRAVALNPQWSSQLQRVLKPGGMVIINSLECKSLRSPGFLSQVTARYRCRHPHYENCVGVFCTGSATVKQWRQRVIQHPRLPAAQKRRALELRLSRL